MESPDYVKSLEERVARLERQVALLMRERKPAARGGVARDARERYDALDYPER